MTPARQSLDEGDPRELYLEGSAEAMLARLAGPIWFRIPGRDRSRCRAVTTLLHGNEPSGLRALHRYLADRECPATDLVCAFGAVSAAQREPVLSHRFAPGGRDLNRCFGAPFRGPEGELARALLDLLREVAPEALVDLHNTSGRGPGYAVATIPDPCHPHLASFFTERLIITDLRLGALTETTSEWFPSIVIECGGAGDPAADRLAHEGLRRFAGAADVLDPGHPLEQVFLHPVRVELRSGCEIAYADAPVPAVDVVLHRDLDRFNFGSVPAGEPLGWVGERGLDALQVRSAADVRAANDFLRVEGYRLLAAHSFRPLMITTQPAIASSDCLFYAIRIE